MASIDIPDVRLQPILSLPGNEDEVILSPDLNMDVAVSSLDELEGEYVTMAGGRVRLITNEADAQAVRVTALYVDRDTRDALRALRGRSLMLRDYAGRLLYGSLLALEVTELGGSVCALSFSFRAITHSPEV